MNPPSRLIPQGGKREGRRCRVPACSSAFAVPNAETVSADGVESNQMVIENSRLDFRSSTAQTGGGNHGVRLHG